MRRFVCVSCGKKTEVNWCTGRRGRDIKCSDCGSRKYRENAGGVSNKVQSDQTKLAVGTQNNTFMYGGNQRKAGKGSCRGNGGDRQGRCRRVIYK